MFNHALRSLKDGDAHPCSPVSRPTKYVMTKAITPPMTTLVAARNLLAPPA